MITEWNTKEDWNNDLNSSKTKYYNCVICGIATQSKNDMDLHFRENHPFVKKIPKKESIRTSINEDNDSINTKPLPNNSSQLDLNTDRGME